jgi:hypothetical protein
LGGHFSGRDSIEQHDGGHHWDCLFLISLRLVVIAKVPSRLWTDPVAIEKRRWRCALILAVAGLEEKDFWFEEKGNLKRNKERGGAEMDEYMFKFFLDECRVVEERTSYVEIFNYSVSWAFRD